MLFWVTSFFKKKYDHRLDQVQERASGDWRITSLSCDKRLEQLLV